MPFAPIAPIAVVTALFVLAGCGHAPPTSTPAAAPIPAATAVPKEAVTESPAAAVPSLSPPASTYPPADGDAGSAGPDRFVAAVQQKLPEVALDRRDEEVEDLGEQACGALEDGRGAPAAAAAVAAGGVPTADARTLVGLARADLCRE